MPCSDYVFVLVDNVIRIFSLGSSTQVALTLTLTLALALTLTRALLLARRSPYP